MPGCERGPLCGASSLRLQWILRPLCQIVSYIASLFYGWTPFCYATVFYRIAKIKNSEYQTFIIISYCLQLSEKENFLKQDFKICRCFFLLLYVDINSSSFIGNLQYFQELCENEKTIFKVLFLLYIYKYI